jgi:hypothetical protein
MKVFYENEQGVITEITDKVDEVTNFKPYKNVYTNTKQL